MYIDHKFNTLLQRKGTLNGLIALYEDNPVRVTELEERMGVAHSTVVRRVDDLTDAGFIQETTFVGNSNQVQSGYELTDKGKQQLARLQQAVEERARGATAPDDE